MKKPKLEHVCQKFVCEECGEQMTGKEKLQVHMKKHHVQKDFYSGTCQCHLCMNFPKKQFLLKHIENHKKDETIECKKCSKVFQSCNVLKEHLRVHKEKQDGECEFCNKEIVLKNIAIAEEESIENRNRIVKQFKQLSDNPDGIEMQKMWKVLKNICPKLKPILPSAKKNHRGKIVSSKNDIKNLLATEYRNRLRPRPYLNALIPTKLRKKKLFSLKIKLAKMNKSQFWTEKDLERALNDLKRNKSRDSEGLVNEIFKNDVIGSDLKHSLLIMCNNIKQENMIPEFMNNANITTVPKKGPKIDLKNQRGIFRVSVVRSILMRLIYNSNYYKIDKNISDSQMGARKGKGCKSNIWIINGIIHETLKHKNKKPIVLQIYDYSQMFDSIDLEEAISDIYDYGLNDDNLSLILKANQTIYMAVKTAGGLTDREMIKNSVLQGDTFGSLLASVQVDTIAREVEKAGIGYNYKEELPINILGLVDDLIGVTEAGFKTQIMNTILNLKSAEKGLQFGTSKCKAMIIGNKVDNVINSRIYVDGWKEEYIENDDGKTELSEKYLGKIPIEEVKKHKYLGFVISSKGDNLENIQEIEKKSFGVIRTIITKLEKLKLGRYYYECSKIFMNVILRGSILYAGECYYNLSEYQLRRIERIEEKFLRKIFKTTRSCPIVQMYLEFGQYPARFELKKMRCLFLKQILNQERNSQLYQFFQLQLKNPVKGDWVTTCLNDLKELKINETLEEIENMSKNKFKNLVKSKILKNALEYLLSKQGSKGQEIAYTSLEMADYLQPFNSTLNIEEKQKLFALRNRMTKIPSNYGKTEEECVCGSKENLPHIYSCKLLSKIEPKVIYNQIYNGNVKTQIEIFRRMEFNLERRNQMKEEKIPCDLRDPLNFNQFGIG